MFPVKFIHLADLHLGKKQYGIPQRYEDYFKAFDWILNKAIDEKVDFILISGDFIDSEKKINPSTLRDIIMSIQRFHTSSHEQLNRNIPIICIEGNHETPFFSDHTWLRLLSDLDLIYLLSAEYNSKTNSLNFEPYSSDKHIGGKISIKGADIHGINWYGTSTPDLFPLIVKEIKKEEDRFNILMMHFGIEGYDKRKNSHAVVSSPLMELNQAIDYLALGHYHKLYKIPENKPWIYNPGSLEVNEFTEVNEERGGLLVEVSSGKPYDFSCKSLLSHNGNSEDDTSIPNRKFITKFKVDIGETKSFEEAENLVISKLRKNGVPEKSGKEINIENFDVPVINFTIEGEVEYSPLDIDLNHLKEQIYENFDILGLKINNDVYSFTKGSIYSADNEGELMSIEQMEDKLLKLTIQGEKKYEPYKEKLVELILDLKSGLLDKPDFETIKADLAKWFDLNSDVFQEFLKSVQAQKKKKKWKPPKKKPEIEKDKPPEEVVEEEWSDNDFEEAFDFDGILGDEDDDLIDGMMDDDGIDDILDEEDSEE